MQPLGNFGGCHSPMYCWINPLNPASSCTKLQHAPCPCDPLASNLATHTLSSIQKSHHRWGRHSVTLCAWPVASLLNLCHALPLCPFSLLPSAPLCSPVSCPLTTGTSPTHSILPLIFLCTPTGVNTTQHTLLVTNSEIPWMLRWALPSMHSAHLPGCVGRHGRLEGIGASLGGIGIGWRVGQGGQPGWTNRLQPKYQTVWHVRHASLMRPQLY